MKRNDQSQAVRGILITLIVTVAPTASAYIGPGAGLSVAGAFWGLVVSLFAALFFIFMWPLRKALRRRQQQADEAAPKVSAQADERG